MTSPTVPLDVIGVDLEEARQRLAAAGERVIVVRETAPPAPLTLEGPWRVVRVRRGADGSIELVVTRERYQLAPNPPAPASRGVRKADPPSGSGPAPSRG